MSESPKKLIPSSVWSATVVVLAVIVGLLMFTNRQPEPSQTFRYELGEFEEVDPALIIYQESSKLNPGLDEVTALASGPDGKIYVGGDFKIVVYDLDGKELERTSLTFSPHCLAIAPDGDILVGMQQHVEVIDGQTGRKSVWENLGERSHITSIAVDEDEVYVADAGQRVVFRFDREGQLLGRLGEEDEAREIPGFIIPSPFFDVAFDTQGTLWAVNPGRHGLENYRANGDLMSAWYRPSIAVDGFCGCCNPSHVAFLSDGSLVTTEKGLARVKVYAPDRVLLGFVAEPAIFDEAPEGAFTCNLPTPITDLAVDQRDRVLVVDNNQKVVRIFELKKEEA